MRAERAPLPVGTLVRVEIDRNPEGVRTQSPGLGDEPPVIPIDRRKIVGQRRNGPRRPRFRDALKRRRRASGEPDLYPRTERHPDDPRLDRTPIRAVQGPEQRIAPDAPRVLVGREIGPGGLQRIGQAHRILDVRVGQQFGGRLDPPVVVRQPLPARGQEPDAPLGVGFRPRDQAGIGFVQTVQIKAEIARPNRNRPEQADQQQKPFQHTMLSLQTSIPAESSAERRKCRSGPNAPEPPPDGFPPFRALRASLRSGPPPGCGHAPRSPRESQAPETPEQNPRHAPPWKRRSLPLPRLPVGRRACPHAETAARAFDPFRCGPFRILPRGNALRPDRDESRPVRARPHGASVPRPAVDTPDDSP